MEAPLLRIAIVSFAIFCSVIINAQEEVNIKDTYVEAESYFLFEEYKDALPLYQKLLRQDPENYNVTYKIGICYLNDPYQKEKSIRYLLDASGHIGKEYRKNNYKEKSAPPETDYYLGQAYRVTGQFGKALAAYAEFKRNLDPAVFDVDVVNDEIESCQVAMKMTQTPVYLTKKNAGQDINSRFADFNAILSGDGKTLVFTRSMQFYDGVFFVKKDDKGNWAPPYNLTPDFGLDGNSYSTGISYYGDEIFVYRSDNFDGNIYSSKLVNGVWQVLKKLNENINTKYWESSASPSPDGKYLYFTSNRKGGYGGLDIYKSPRNSDGGWGVPVNLGPIVNSKYNEDSPFISPDNHRLYFSSLGHDGMGGYDIFISEMNGPSSWSRPVNMGFPVNSSDDDMFFCPVGNSEETGIMSLYDENSTNGLMDIYWVKVYNSVLPRPFTITGKVNAPAEKLLQDNNVNVSIIDNTQGKIIEQVTANDSGEFTIHATQGNYQLLIDGKGIKPVTIPLSLALTQESSDIELPVIAAQIAAVGEDVLIATPSELPTLKISGDKNIITEKSPVEIKLNIDAGNKLTIENFVDGKPDSKEEIIAPKNNYTYILTPKPGDNRLVFTIHDNKGNINQQEVNVYFKAPVEEAPVTAQQSQATISGLDEIASLAEGNLQNYIKSLQSINYKSLSDLYQILSTNAEANGYTLDEVNNLITLLLAQRNKQEFIESSKTQKDLGVIYNNDTLIASTNLPVVIVQGAKTLNMKESGKIDKALVNIIPFTGPANDLLNYILSFDKDFSAGDIRIDNIDDVYQALTKSGGVNKASKSIELSATTANLDQFFYNLLMTADSSLKQTLVSMDFDSLNINNSVDLVKHLFNLVDEGRFSMDDIIKSIENSRDLEDQNLLKFKESLANAATGGLKAHIQEVDIENQAQNSYLKLIETLIRDSQTKGYNKSGVYNLLIKMIGIENVEGFIKEMRKYSKGDLDSVLTKVSKGQFANPLELIQYLLSESPNYDFSDSDINNLLIKMLLERDISGHEVMQPAPYSKELMQKRRFISTIVLANLLLIVLLIMLWKRKKNKGDNQHA